MSKTEIPEPWATRLIERGFTDGRFTYDVPSMGALSTKTGLHTSTISATFNGKRRPTVETVRVLVRELGEDVAAWLNVTLSEPFEAPPEADLLNPRQRKAITELIRSMVGEVGGSLTGHIQITADAEVSKKEGGGGHERGSSSTSKASQRTLRAVAKGGDLSPEAAAKADRQARNARRRQEKALEDMKGEP